MSVDLIQHASIAGELAENLWGRTDFEKYDSAWAQLRNWVVDYRGGAFTRMGFEFGDIIQASDLTKVKFVEFQYSPDEANTYMVIFTHQKIRFVHDNAYILETAKNVTAVANGTASRVTVTSNSHGYSDGNWVKLYGFTHASLLFLNGRTVQVANSASNTFSLIDPITGADITTAISTGTGQVARIYTVTSPYDEDDLHELQVVQIRDVLRMTHKDYNIKNLIRNDVTDWEIQDEALGTSMDPVTGLAKVGQSRDSEKDIHVYQVTAVSEDGEEGPPGIILLTELPDITTQNDRWISISWSPVVGAVKYNVYRSRKSSNSTASGFISDMEVGYIGRAIGTQFSDPGITPDYSIKPPKSYNPFADGRIRYVKVIAQGSGYSYDSAITWPSGGAGAYGYLVVRTNTGPILGVEVLNGGENYTNTTVTAATGTGATLEAVLSPTSGNNPRCCAIYQQRMLYGSTDNYPLRIFGSKTGFLANFDYSDIGAPDDGYEFDLDAEKISPLRHLVPVRGGLLVANQLGWWLVQGRGNETLTGSNAQADPQVATGASLVRPILVDSYVIYATSQSEEIRMLAYDDYAKVFADQNLSLLSNHLYQPGTSIRALTYAPIPHKTICVVKENGELITCTIDVPNSVYAMSPHSTRGHFRHCLTVLEEEVSRLYVAVEREINGRHVLYFERQAERSHKVLEDAFCVDAGLRLPITYPAGRLAPTTFTGAVTFHVEDATPFVLGDVGKVIRCGSGRATITAYVDSNTVNGTWDRDLEEAKPESAVPAEFPSGTWSMDTPTDTIRGLWHLEGETVTGLADGQVIEKTVSNGTITLDTPVTRLAVGLPYTCIAQTLPATVGDLVLESRRKSFAGIGLRIHQTAKLKTGRELSNLYEIQDKAQTLWGAANRLRNEIIYEPTRKTWERDESLYIVQDLPMPATILAHIRDMDLGDGKGEVRGDDT